MGEKLSIFSLSKENEGFTLVNRQTMICNVTRLFNTLYICTDVVVTLLAFFLAQYNHLNYCFKQRHCLTPSRYQ